MATLLRTNAKGLPVFCVADKTDLPEAHQGSGRQGKLFELELPLTLVEVAAGAFDGCAGLAEVKLPPALAVIGEGAFKRCTGLTQLNIPELVTKIGTSAFSFCSGLTQIQILGSVTEIGERAFGGCSGLTELQIPESATKIEIRPCAFSGCSKLTQLQIPGSVTEIQAHAFQGSGLTQLNIPESVTKIGEYAFDGCSGLTQLNIPESVTEIGDSAFDGCSGLTQLNIPESVTVTEIGEKAFRFCSGLTQLNIPESVTEIGKCAFDGCSGLTQLNIPESVTEIGEQAFSGCSRLTQLNIPESVTKIKEHAFNGCSGLTQFQIPKSVTEIGKCAFSGCSGLIALTLPNADVSLAEDAFDMHCVVPMMAPPTELFTTNPQALCRLVEVVTRERAGRERLAILRADLPMFEEMCIRYLKPLFEANDPSKRRYVRARPGTTVNCLQPGLTYRFEFDSLQLTLLPNGEDVLEGGGGTAFTKLVVQQVVNVLEPVADPFPWLRQLLELGPDPRAELCGGRSALDFAIHWRLPEACAWLLDKNYVQLDALSLTHPTVLAAKACTDEPTIKKWGDSFGQFLGRYAIEEGDPKHVSATCCVVFAVDLQAVDRFVVTAPGSPNDTKTTHANIEALFDAKGWNPDAVTLKAFREAVEAGAPFRNLKISSIKPKQVVLKFMHDQEAFQRELTCRKGGLGDTAAVISIIDHYRPDTITAASLKAFSQVRLSTDTSADGGTVLDHLLVLERGSTDLSDVISHGDLAGNNMLKVRTIAAFIAKCLQTMHSMAVIHGDVKSRNFVMLSDGEYAAIDLDAAATINPLAAANLAPTDPQRLQYLAGRKPTSSGCLPPEQAAVVLHRRRRIAAVFRHIAADAAERPKAVFDQFYDDIELDEAARPATFMSFDEDGNGLVSMCEFCAFFADLTHDDAFQKYHKKNCSSGESTNVAEIEQLKARQRTAIDDENYDENVRLSRMIVALKAAQTSSTPEPVIASESYDMWGFGVLLYELVTGVTLFRIDVREEAVDDFELTKIVEWSDADKKEALNRVEDKSMQDLLDMLLHKDRNKRPKDWNIVVQILEHLSADSSNAGTNEIKALLAKLRQEVSENGQEIRNMLDDLSDQLTDATNKLASEINKQGSATRKFMLELTAVTVPYLFDIVEESEPGLFDQAMTAAGRELNAQALTASELKEDPLAAIEKRVSWCRQKLSRAQEMLKSPVETAAKFIEDNSDKTVYLRLLCGVTLEPVVVYAIPVQENNEKVNEYLKKSAKMMGIGLKVAATWNAVAGVTSLFGIRLPAVSKTYTDHIREAQEFVKGLQTTSDADVAARMETEAAGMTRGELEEFAKYLEKLESEANGDDQPRWKDKLFAIQDPSALGRMTYTTDERAGTYGGAEQKDAIEAFRAAASPASVDAGNGGASTGQLSTNQAEQGSNARPGGTDQQRTKSGVLSEENLLAKFKEMMDTQEARIMDQMPIKFKEMMDAQEARIDAQRRPFWRSCSRPKVAVTPAAEPALQPKRR